MQWLPNYYYSSSEPDNYVKYINAYARLLKQMSSRSQEDPERRFFEQNVNHSKEKKKETSNIREST